MSKAPKKNFLCIHGHFYQPPRENAWLEHVELQESAAPEHDWNERIYKECYLPNARARVLDAKGRILDIVNNYETISFNFGPTLLSWLESRHPRTYHLICNADLKSQAKHRGHGNAIAQVYNHIIMPLANRRDKVTQVRWGIADFKKRFGRLPESMWLAETACNEETLEVLVEEGMKYVILEPHQAQAVRSFESPDWQDVSNGQIDPKQPYRCFLKKYPEKFIDIFFYDGPISKAVSFEAVLDDAKNFIERIETARDSSRSEDQLIHLATDGETYGHHKSFADRVLAYLMNVEAASRGYAFVNYAEYLEAHPPKLAVRLKNGENGEGTSWSCAHGVKRWKEHCGCRGDGPAEWTQHWRGPLRGALDGLRDAMAAFYEEKGKTYLKDVWAARNDYIGVVLERTPEAISAFLEAHATRVLSEDERVTVFKLLEIQRHAMLMYTSCGWFFTELSGIETVQIIQYAARALQLAREVGEGNWEEEFLKRLEAAKSNVPEFKDGRSVYEQLVKPKIVSMDDIVGYYGICSLLENHGEGEENPFYAFRMKLLHQRRESYGDVAIHFARVRVLSEVTREEKEKLFVAVRVGFYDFRCTVKEYSGREEMDSLEAELFEESLAVNTIELLKKIDTRFSGTHLFLKDLPVEERVRIITMLTREEIDKLGNFYQNLFDQSRKMNQIYRSINLPIPKQVRSAVEYALNEQIRNAIKHADREGFDAKTVRVVNRIFQTARSFEVPIKEEGIRHQLSGILYKRMKRLVQEVRGEVVEECLQILRLCKKTGVSLDLMMTQDHYLDLIKKWKKRPETLPQELSGMTKQLLDLLEALNINADVLKQALKNPGTGLKTGS